MEAVVGLGRQDLLANLKQTAAVMTLKLWWSQVMPRLVDYSHRVKEIKGSSSSISFACLVFLTSTLLFLACETVSRWRGVRWVLRNPVPSEVEALMRPFILTEEQLRQSMSLFLGQVEKGLNPASKASSSVKCFTTYVQELPTGQESGRFLALDVGGSNFRVLMVTLHGMYSHMDSRTYVIPEKIMVGTGDELFDFIARSLINFTKEMRVEKANLPLGFTFSFPLEQRGLEVGVLQRWTKGFDCSGVIDQDVTALLKAALRRQSGNIDVVAVLNDTTGTLISCAWKNPKTKIGVILGTGTNACYMERIQNIPGFDGDPRNPVVLVNTEWGAFGDNGELDFLTTNVDKEVDKKSINPGKQLHEKLISGMYLGEIVRLLLVKLIQQKIILQGVLTEDMAAEGMFLTKYLSVVESDKRGNFEKCRKVMAALGYPRAEEGDYQVVRYVCECVSRRAAYLASAGIAALTNKMGYPSLTIGVDGALYQLHPHFRRNMVEKISQLLDPAIEDFTLMLATDGSGRGAALVAASVSRAKSRR